MHNHKSNYWVRIVSVAHRTAFDKWTQRMNHAVHSDCIVHTRTVEEREVIPDLDPDTEGRCHCFLCYWMCEKKSERRWQSLLGLITFSSIFRLREVKSVMDTDMKQKSLCPIKKRHLFWVWMLPRVFSGIFRASHQKIKSHNAAVDPNELRVSAGSKKKVCQDKTKWLLGCC